jgi:hypothetical protein
MLKAPARHLTRLYPWSVETGAELDRAVAFLGWTLRAETVVRVGYGAAMVVALVGSLSAAVVPPSVRLPALALVVGGCLGVAHAVRRAPDAPAAARRTTALGEAPDLVARAVLRMRLTPTAEGAAAFAAETGDGPLATSLADHVRRAEGTSASALSGFASEWADWHPSLRRAVLLVEAAADAPPGQRERTLERALSAVLDGTRRELARFAGEIRGPATGLYAFGVLLPLALVAVLPAARAAGFPLTLPVVAFVYDAALPATLVAASTWLLVRRPVAFPPPRVSREHPSVPDRRWPVVAASLGVGIVAWTLVALLGLPGWTRTIVPLGAASGSLLAGWYRPFAAVRARTREIESGLPDALFLVGRRIEDGCAAEVAIGRVKGELAGPMGEVLADASRLLAHLPVTLREAFLGEHGSLADVPSVRARSTAALLTEAAAEGQPAGQTVVAMADHLAELLDVERAARRELATVTDTLGSTATLFGPGVAGATLALSAGLGSGCAAGPTAALPLDGLGVALGVYVLLLSAILAGLSAGLQHGLDRSVVGYRVGLALLAATVVYPTTYVGAATLVAFG